jgi:hypothetical protein
MPVCKALGIGALQILDVIELCVRDGGEIEGVICKLFLVLCGLSSDIIRSKLAAR